MTRPYPCPSCRGDGNGDDEGRCEQCAGHGMLRREGGITLPWRPVMPAPPQPQAKP